MLDPHAIIIYTDGSAYNNPGGNGGIAGLVVYPEVISRENEIIFCQGYLKTTNNRMELRAGIEAIRWIRFTGSKLGIPRTIIITDSQYTITCWKYANIWQHAGWVSHDGLPIENDRLIKELISVRAKVKSHIDIQWQAGKTDDKTKLVDSLAKNAANGFSLKADEGFTYAKISSTKVSGGHVTIPCSVGASVIGRIYKKETHYKTGLVKVSFDVYSRLENKYISKRHAYAEISIASELHRQHHYELLAEGEKRVPQIVKYKEIPIFI